MVLEAKNALGRVPTLNADLLDLDGYYFCKGDMFWIAVDDDDRVIGCAGCNLLPVCKIQFEKAGHRDAAFKCCREFC